MDGIAFSLFGFDIQWYSLLILVGVVIAYFLINSEAKRFDVKKEFVFNLMFWTLIFGIIGARLYYVAFNLDYYMDNLKEIFYIWNGGLAIHGGMIAGILTIVIYCAKYKVKLARILDIIVPGLIIAQAIGRWGNYFNVEAYGRAVTHAFLEGLVIIPDFIIDNMFINGQYHLPMFYFESLWCLLGFFVILFIRRRRYIKVGQIFSFYLIWYGVARFVIEAFRTDALMFGDIRVAQVVSCVMIVVGLVITLIQSRKPKLEELYNKMEIEEIKF